VRRTLPVSLTFDHRVVTGIEAANFLKAVIKALESPSQFTP
jgi:pyruvate dehydrogenase E2 component (dihydrolipoamide acetyltransferase)